jgi:ribosome-associated toxin RatA of RatAB toxin-antitoxin module
MPTVDVSLSIGVPAQEAWSTVIDVESYPECMDVVRSVEILADLGGNRRRTGWSVLLRGSVLEWVEQEYLDHDAMVITFEQQSGDLEQFSGGWSVRPAAVDRCEVTLHVEFDIGIPLLADMLNPVAEGALRDSAKAMLLGLEHRIVGSVPEATWS